MRHPLLILAAFHVLVLNWLVSNETVAGSTTFILWLQPWAPTLPYPCAELAFAESSSTTFILWLQPWAPTLLYPCAELAFAESSSNACVDSAGMTSGIQAGSTFSGFHALNVGAVASVLEEDSVASAVVDSSGTACNFRKAYGQVRPLMLPKARATGVASWFRERRWSRTGGEKLPTGVERRSASSMLPPADGRDGPYILLPALGSDGPSI